MEQTVNKIDKRKVQIGDKFNIGLEIPNINCIDFYGEVISLNYPYLKEGDF